MRERTTPYPEKARPLGDEPGPDDSAARPGKGAPGEDAMRQPKGRRGEAKGELSGNAVTEGVEPLPGRRLDTKTGEIVEED